MLGWLANQFSSADDVAAPLASAKGTRALLIALEGETPEHAVRELARHFKDTPHDVLMTPRGVGALQELDEWAQGLLACLWQSVLGDTQGLTVSEMVWEALAQYYRRSYVAYWICLEAHGNSVPLPKREQAKAMTIAARAMAAASKYMLALRLRYITAPKETWSHIWNLIGWSDQQGSATEQVDLYPSGVKTTIERELLTALLIEVAPTSGLLPGQILALERLLRMHAEHYQRSDRYDARTTPFAYDRSRPEPPQRWFSAVKVRPELRFFGVCGAYDNLCSARADTQALRNTPGWLSQTRCSATNYAELLNRIVAEWSLDPPRRRHQRVACSGEILVAHDWGDIHRVIKFSELALSGRSLAYETGHGYKMYGVMAFGSNQSHSKPHGGEAVSTKEALANLLAFEKMLTAAATETWGLQDTSESGIGATSETDCAWVKVGMVIAFRHRESPEWRIALVRRLERSANGRLIIGLARLGDKVRAARLRPGIGRIEYNATPGRNEPAVDYAALMPQDDASAMLLPIGLFETTQKYTLSCEDRQHVVKMEQTRERGLNFERVEFSRVELQCAA